MKEQKTFFDFVSQTSNEDNNILFDRMKDRSVKNFVHYQTLIQQSIIAIRVWLDELEKNIEQPILSDCANRENIIELILGCKCKIDFFNILIASRVEELLPVIRRIDELIKVEAQYEKENSKS
jgi:hypothetical protein